MNDITNPAASRLEAPVVIPVEAYVSEAYVRAEGERLWPKVWQIACRVEEIPKVGDYVTYDILDESIIVTRTAPDRIQGFYNVCLHRGRRLTEGCGHTAQFYCRFHGWRWNLDGENAFVLDREDWGEALTNENLRMKQVRVDTWGGWVWINMDPDCEPLLDYLKPASSLLDPFELEKMRYRWRQWLNFPCNWKTALEAFNESYHARATHPQLTKWVDLIYWSRTAGRHACHGVATPREGGAAGGSGFGGVNVRDGQDPRTAAAEMMLEMEQTLDATTTRTIIEAAQRLPQELPPGTPAELVAAHMMASAARDDAARGVVWPALDPEKTAEAGFDWHLFPNSVILPGVTFALCYRARPNGADPNSCIFEVYVIERFPEGEEPKTEWVYEPDPTEEKWRLILSQDFQNMPKVQQGMKSRGFPGARPSPRQEVAIIQFHRMLAQYIGTGAPEAIR
ncbi:aromatic ring-hydroxylating dioxygenase subunit alpha [Phenylobacterium sp. LjRoot225]|uniref:aromatic ring-hydroxylating oxygenase subunit alpha n=1 Tax=Phenylobacterium sp. LjRoot225 TaxID=3342285 RepID=UPI003ECC4DDD